MIASAPRPPRVGIPYRTRKEELTGDFSRIKQYVAAVQGAGADPVVVSLGRSREELKKLVKSLGAVVLSGSPADVDPSLYHATRDPKTAEADSYRDHTDFALLEYAFAEQKPVLAICFGIQSLNVFLGGTLLQDIPSEVGSSVEHEWEDEQGAPETFHPIHIDRQSMLATIAGGTEAVVNSSHHQSVLQPGRNLRVVARSEDQVIEAVEWTGDSNWVMGVQWHPERMVEKDALAQSLFRTLVRAARRAELQA
jgi:putative glutamine amidotransferase